MAEVTITVQPGWEAALVGIGALAAIDLAAIRWGYATISRLIRHQIHEHPVIAFAPRCVARFAFDVRIAVGSGRLVRAMVGQEG